MRYAKQYALLTATIILAFSCTQLAQAQLNQNCTVSVLNRTVQANPDGSWVLPNVPSNIGQVRARATCVRNGVTTSGQSDFFTVPSNGVINQATITFGTVAPVPGVLKVASSNSTLNSIGATAQLTVTSTFADGTTGDFTSAQSGTNYTTSNPAVATVSPDGLVTAVSSGSALISAMNEGALGVIAINVVLSGSSHGGIPDDWALAHGLDPNDPAMPFEDPDHDGLTNLQEFQHGTDPHNPDTDGDGIPDGLEVAEGTDPLNPNSFNLGKALKFIQVVPPVFTINVNTLLLEGSQQLIVTGTLNDQNGTQIDLTPTRKGTNYNSSDLTVCNFGAVDGQIFGGNTGTCTITVTNSGFTTKAVGTVKSFTPSEVSTLNVPGAVAVDVAGDFAYIAAGSNGLVVVDVSNRNGPFARGTLPGIGNAQGIRVAGEYAFIADANGFLRVAHILNPDSPTLVASLAIPGNPIALAVHSNLALIAAQSAGVSIVNITDPTAPALVNTFTAPAPAIGVDFDKQRNLAAVAMGTAGLQLFDISNPASPQALGLLPGGNVRRVLLKFPAALLADSQRSVTAVNITDAQNPVLSSSVAANLGGAPVDIASFGNIAITADVSFGRAIPIVNVINPLQPQSLGFWTLLSPGFSSSIAMDSAYGYLIIPGLLRIFHYRILVDPPGTPPTASISSPVAGTTVIERQTIPVTVIAADDVAVASVSLTINGQIVDTLTSPPYQFSFQVPVGVSTVTLGALAVDLAGDTGKALPVQLNVIPDPGTTAVGKVVDVGGNPVANANVSTFGGRSSTTGSDGSFSITQVPTVLGNIVVTAVFNQPDGSILKGISAGAVPVPLGTTQVGTITVVPVPIITSMSRKSALAGTQVTFHVTGTTLGGSTFSFAPASSPSIKVQSSSIDPTGTSATLTVSVPSGISGTFALVATNIAGSSSATITPINRLTVVNPSSRADSDGDGFQDVVEAFFGTDPLDPNSIPTIPSLLGEAESASFTIQNNAGPGGTKSFEMESPAFIVLNGSQPATGVTHEADSPTFTVVNGSPATGVTREADSQLFSLQNNSPSVTPGGNRFEAESQMFSLQNAIPRTEAESLTFTVLNQSQSAKPIFREADSLPFSARNTAAPPPHVASNFEAESLPFSVLNTNASVSPGTNNLEVESLAFTVSNNSQSTVRSVVEMESSSFSVLNTSAVVNPSINNFETESQEFSVRNVISPPVPGTQKFEAESLPFILLNPSQPVQPMIREVESASFSLLNTNPFINPAVNTLEADSQAFSVLNSNTAVTHNFEADSPVFTVVNGSPATGVTREADSLLFSLQNNSPFVTSGSNRFEAESPMFSLQNAIPRPEAEGLFFTVLNQHLSATPIFREADSLPFSVQNTIGPPPHVVSKFETESLPFSILNTNATTPGTRNFEAESSGFSVLNSSPPATRSIFELESSSFSVLNANSGNPGANIFEMESLEFSVRNTAKPQPPGTQRLEADSWPFSLLNSSQTATPAVHEAGSPAFSILNTNAVLPVNTFEADSSVFTIKNNNQSASPASFEVNSSSFSLLNGAPPLLLTLEADSWIFTVNNKPAPIIAQISPRAAKSRVMKRSKRRVRAPAAALRTTSSRKQSGSQKSNAVQQKTDKAPTSQTSSGTTAGSVSDASRTDFK